MNNVEIMAFLKAEQLPSAHASFAVQFLSADMPVKQIVAIPQGGGKGRLLMSVAKSIASQGGKVLFLVDRTNIKKQLYERFRHDGFDTVELDRPAMRLLQADVADLHVKWQPGKIYISTVQLISADDVKPQILETSWDLIALDDVGSPILLEELSSSSSYRRLLLTLSAHRLRANFRGFQNHEIHELGMIDLDSKPKATLEFVEFTRTQVELDLLKQTIEFSDQIPSVSNLAVGLTGRSVLLRAASSFYALEVMLTRLRQVLLVQRNLAAHNADANMTNFRLLVSSLKLLDELLSKLDELEIDSKQQALLQLRRSLASIIVYTPYRDTANYLNETLQHSDGASISVHGSQSFEDSESSLSQFRALGGVLFVTDAKRLIGYDFQTLISAVVLYDIPQSDIELGVLMTRNDLQNGKVFLLRDTATPNGDSLEALQSRLRKIGWSEA